MFEMKRFSRASLFNRKRTVNPGLISPADNKNSIVPACKEGI